MHQRGYIFIYPHVCVDAKFSFLFGINFWDVSESVSGAPPRVGGRIVWAQMDGAAVSITGPSGGGLTRLPTYHSLMPIDKWVARSAGCGRGDAADGGNSCSDTEPKSPTHLQKRRGVEGWLCAWKIFTSRNLWQALNLDCVAHGDFKSIQQTESNPYTHTHTG